MADSPALAIIEFSSVAVGTRAFDALLKKAIVTIERAGTVQPGKFVVLFTGEVGSVDEAYVECCRIGAESLLDSVFLPDVDLSVRAAILGQRGDWMNDTLGIIETQTLSAVIDASDAAVKSASVSVVEIRLGDGLGGKGLAHFTGLQADVEHAIQVGRDRIASRQITVCTAIIPRADEGMLNSRSQSTRFGEGW